mmetsp:Transcript_12855/g.38813  ORF Transcript_12855/g.38813 Transcript_12855/m.38813 type:complete len:290 (-) Transcript_12855:686-1555(-)
MTPAACTCSMSKRATVRPWASACSSGMREPEGTRPPTANRPGSSARTASSRRSTPLTAPGALTVGRVVLLVFARLFATPLVSVPAVARLGRSSRCRRASWNGYTFCTSCTLTSEATRSRASSATSWRGSSAATATCSTAAAASSPASAMAPASSASMESASAAGSSCPSALRITGSRASSSCLKRGTSTPCRAPVVPAVPIASRTPRTKRATVWALILPSASWSIDRKLTTADVQLAAALSSCGITGMLEAGRRIERLRFVGTETGVSFALFSAFSTSGMGGEGIALAV